MNNKNLVVSLFLVFLISSCSTGTVAITSIPAKANIQIINSDGTLSEVGEVGNYTEDKIFQSSKVVQLLVSKKNYFSQSVVLTKAVFSRDYNISVNLKPDEEKTINLSQDIEEVAKAVATSFHMLTEKDYSGVIYLLTPITSKFSGVSVTQDLLANAYYLKGDYRKAYKYYKAALAINPSNFKRQEIVNKIKDMINE